MSFDVFLIASDASPVGDEMQAATDRALALCGARRGRAGECDFVLASGQDQEFFGSDDGEAGGMFALRGLSPEIVQLVFEVADATRCFIIFPGDDPAALRTPSNVGELAGADGMPVEPVADARELAQRLGAPFGDWADYARDSIGRAPPSDDVVDQPEIDPSLLDRFFKPSNKD